MELTRESSSSGKLFIGIIIGAAISGAIALVFVASMISMPFVKKEEVATTDTGTGLVQGQITPIGEKEIPKEFLPIYKAAGEKYSVPWNLLAAHHFVETRFSSIKNMTSSVGAVGHMQFMKKTWIN